MRKTNNELNSFHLIKPMSLLVREEEEVQDGLSRLHHLNSLTPH
jgi:hypothetical protein